MNDLNDIDDSLFDESVEFEIGPDLDNDKSDRSKKEDSQKKSKSDEKITIGNDFSLLKDVGPNQINFDGLGLEELGITKLAIIRPDLHPFLNDLPWKLRYNLESLLQTLFRDKALLAIIKTLVKSKDLGVKAKEAFNKLIKLCNAQPRNAEAHYVLALCYQYGLGIDSKVDIHNSGWNDNENTISLYILLDKAANLNDLPVAKREILEWAYSRNEHVWCLNDSYNRSSDPYISFWINFCKQFQRNEDRYRLWKKDIFEGYLMSAEKGDPYGQVMVGYCYEIGYSVKQNFLKALFFYNLADCQEAPFAKYRLAHLYEHLGVHQKASDCYKEAAQDHFEMILPNYFLVKPHECSSKMAEERLKIMPILFEYFENRFDGLAFMVKEYLGADYSTPPRKAEFEVASPHLVQKNILLESGKLVLVDKDKSKERDKSKRNEKCIIM